MQSAPLWPGSQIRASPSQLLPAARPRRCRAPPPADSYWVSSAERRDAEGALRAMSQADMLACDSATLMVQLNIRLLLEVGAACCCSKGEWCI